MIINENGVDRKMTDEEVAQHDETLAAIAAEKAEREQAAAEALEARKAPLRRLGLTEDEINTVLGL